MAARCSTRTWCSPMPSATACGPTTPVLTGRLRWMPLRQWAVSESARRLQRHRGPAGVCAAVADLGRSHHDHARRSWLPAGAGFLTGKQREGAYADLVGARRLRGHDRRPPGRGDRARRLRSRLDPTTFPGTVPSNIDAVTTNLFFIVNYMHDLFYDSATPRRRAPRSVTTTAVAASPGPDPRRVAGPSQASTMPTAPRRPTVRRRASRCTCGIRTPTKLVTVKRARRHWPLHQRRLGRLRSDPRGLERDQRSRPL